jgi:hypothetical protein
MSCVFAVSSPFLYRNVLFGELFCLLRFWLLLLDRWNVFLRSYRWSEAWKACFNSIKLKINLLGYDASIFYPEDGGISFLQNVGTYLPNYLVSRSVKW